MERLDAEMRFHARTVARLEAAKQATRDALAAEGKRGEEKDEFKALADKYYQEAQDEKAARRTTKGVSIAALVLLIILGFSTR
jgi:hypothetical protein